MAHQDLKPSNILVCNQHLKGVAHDETAMGKAYEQCLWCRYANQKAVAMSKTHSTNCGTPAYMAPEMQLN